MSIEITFVRHAETEANAAGIWQGHGPHPLSERGTAQAAALGERLSDKEFDVVLVSDLARTRETAELAGFDATPDPAWREIDIGRWEGLSRDEVRSLFPEEAAAFQAGAPVAIGGGESWAAFSARVRAALDDLVAGTPAGSRVLVLTHGGNVNTVLGSGLGFDEERGSWPLDRVGNASVTETIVHPDGFHLQSYNDARHAGPGREMEDTVAMVRHAESEANVEGRWHGTTDGPLSDRGLAQASEAAATLGDIDRLYSSPLARARLTAEAVAASQDLRVCLEPGLVELDFGSWEDLTRSEIADRYPDDWREVFEELRDIPRGGSGETFADAGVRMERVVTEVAALHPDDRIALVSHGASIWALVARMLRIDWPRWRSLALPVNTGISHVRVTSGVLRLVDYNLAPR